MRKLLKKVLSEPVKALVRRARFCYYNLSYIYHSRKQIRNADTSRPVEAAVFIMIAENWNSFESLYRCIAADSRINLTVYVFPGHVFTDKPEELNLKLYAEVLAFFADRGINVVKAYDPESDTWISPESVKADYIFYDEPYYIYPKEFLFNPMYKRARLCYIPYSYIFSKREYMLNGLMPLEVFRFVFAVFAPADFVADHVEKNYGRLLCKYHHVLRLGYPRFDLTYKLAETTYQGVGCRVIWNPRFTMSDYNNWDPSSRTTFFEFRSKILGRASQHTDEYWIIRPHPRAFSEYLSKGMLTKEELNQYISSLENKPRTELDKKQRLSRRFHEK